MLDTIGVEIPLTESQFNKLHQLVHTNDQWEWGKINFYQMKQSSDPRDFIHIKRVRSVAKLRRGSWEKDLVWSISNRYIPNEGLQVEASLPKLFYRGENIHLLYEPMSGLMLLKRVLEKQFGLRLPDPLTWRLLRADIAYAWKCPTQTIAQQLLDSFKGLTFPWKTPIIYDTGIYFPGKTYTIKVYLKLQDFWKHDKKSLLKLARFSDSLIQQKGIEWFVNTLEKAATGVIRFEVELHRLYFRDSAIKTVGDLLTPKFFIELDAGLAKPELKDLSDMHSIMMISLYRMIQENQTGALRDYMIKVWDLAADGDRFEAPEGFELNPEFRQKVTENHEATRQEMKRVTVGFSEEIDQLFSHSPLDDYHHPGGGYTVRKQDRLLGLLVEMWRKFLGDELGMADLDKAQARLEAKYKRSKVARLLGFYQYFNTFGERRAKELYGRDAYYRSLRDLESAQVPLGNPKVVDLDQSWLNDFKCSIPSLHVINHETLVPQSYETLFEGLLDPELMSSQTG